MQLSLLHERNPAEITAPDYPGERLIVCRNPDLARERACKRDEPLAATERDLSRVAAGVIYVNAASRVASTTPAPFRRPQNPAPHAA